MQIIENIALISINETLIIQVISFLIFLFIINRIMFRPLNRVMKERVDYMDKLKQDVIDARDEITRVTNQLSEQKVAARQEALMLKREMESLGSEEATEIFADARNEITELKHKAIQEVQAQIEDAKEHIQSEAETLAIGIMEKILNRRLSS